MAELWQRLASIRDLSCIERCCTIGYAWKSDYGDPEEKIKNLEYNKQYSPLHNVKLQGDESVPGLMILTADQDDRVVAHHSLKFVAEVQKVHEKHQKIRYFYVLISEQGMAAENLPQW